MKLNCEKCKEIQEGWTALTKHMMGALDKQTANMANTRRKICDDCDQLQPSKIQFLTCVQCGCYYPMLAYSKTKKCPLGKWSYSLYTIH